MVILFEHRRCWRLRFQPVDFVREGETAARPEDVERHVDGRAVQVSSRILTEDDRQLPLDQLEKNGLDDVFGFFRTPEQRLAVR